MIIASRILNFQNKINKTKKKRFFYIITNTYDTEYTFLLKLLLNGLSSLMARGATPNELIIYILVQWSNTDIML